MQKIRQDENIDSNIRNLRIAAQLTQEEVITYLQLQGIDISRSIYSQIECGTYNIKVSELRALTIVFNCDYNAFFDWLGFLDYHFL